jgi:hypothetical protein
VVCFDVLCCLCFSEKALEKHGTVENFKADLKRQSLKRTFFGITEKGRDLAGLDLEFKVKATFDHMVQNISHHTTPHHHTTTTQHNATQYNTAQHHTPHTTHHTTTPPHYTAQHTTALESKVKVNFDSLIKKL